MRLVLVTELLVLAGCGGRTSSRQPLPKWQFGYWFWNGSSAATEAGSAPLDALYFQAGTISLFRFRGEKPQWHAPGTWPPEIPAAREYWAVFRFERQAVPDAMSTPVLGHAVEELQREARRRGLRLAGVQLDIDSPSRSLAAYGAYLRAVRKHLPAGSSLSITALLDWFRPGTAIGEVVDAVDEFVPQFYDLRNPGSVFHSPAIAAPIDAAKWSPTFNRFGKRYRIGISTFGRSRVLGPERPSGMYPGIRSYGDLKPFDVGVNSAFALETSTTEAKELVLRYRAQRKTVVGYTGFEAGTAFEFVLSTPESIRAAVEQARQMGQYCGGVVFFRWPSFHESMAARPDEVLAAAGAAKAIDRPVEIRAIDEHCAAVHCADLYLNGAPALREKAIVYVIEISTALEYFLPEKDMPVKMTGPVSLELTVPPYCGRTQLHIGRAVTAAPALYKLREKL
ncbi:MAG: DUF3142 domain-containing protein [Acidobacteria bacterium]|nr:DUF3142 domain-containing protein [Acidobacteriota bacterium]